MEPWSEEQEGAQAGSLPVPFYMVAVPSHSMPVAGGNRAHSLICATLLVSAMASVDNKPSAAVTLPLFPKERPLASEVSDWIDAAKPMLPADQRSLIDGIEPRALLVYTHSRFSSRCIGRYVETSRCLWWLGGSA